MINEKLNYKGELQMNQSMHCAVERFVKAKENGLCLIDMPTGTGKTYLTQKIIGRYIRKEILQDV